MRGLPALRTLSLFDCHVLRDLSALRRSLLVDLTLIGVENANLRTLGGARPRSLRIRHQALADGLSALPSDLPLERLIIENRAGVPLTGIERWQGLKTVVVHAEPTEVDRQHLARLPQLRTFEVRTPEARPPTLPPPPQVPGSGMGQVPMGRPPWEVEDPATSPHLPHPSYLDESLPESERDRHES